MLLQREGIERTAARAVPVLVKCNTARTEFQRHVRWVRGVAWAGTSNKDVILEGKIDVECGRQNGVLMLGGQLEERTNIGTYIHRNIRIHIRRALLSTSLEL